MYNLFRQMGAIEDETIVLEPLAILLDDAVFQGTRPVKNFNSRWATFIGSKLEFKRPGKSKRIFHSVYPGMAEDDQDQDFKAGWRLGRGELTEKHLDEHRLSYFHTIHDTNYDSRDERAAPAWAKALGMRKGSVYKHFQSAIYHTPSYKKTLEKLERTVASVLEGDFPVAKVKWFEIYLTCTQILEDIARVLLDTSEKDPNRDTLPGKCLYELSGLLPMADECVEQQGGRRLFREVYGPTIDIVKPAIGRAMKGESSMVNSIAYTDNTTGKKTADFV
jgi:hypothetical protein